jgi:hypothetical protein
VPDSYGNLASIFEKGIRESLIEQKHFADSSCEGDEYRISPLLEDEITMMPSLVDWIMTSILTKDRHILLNPSWAIY